MNRAERPDANDLVLAVVDVVASKAMPTLAIIEGIKITMYYADHEPAHFHAIAGEDEIVVAIADMRVIAGHAPPGVVQRVRTWARRHQAELALCWVCCRAGQKPGRIEG